MIPDLHPSREDVEIPTDGAQVSPDLKAASRPSESREDQPGVLSVWRDSILLLAAYAYFAGYSYIRGYYRVFEIDSSVLDMSVYNHLVYSFFALNSWRGAIACSVLLVTFRVIQARKLSAVIIFVFALGVFVVLYHVARIQGAADAAAVRAGFRLPRVELGFKDDKAGQVWKDSTAGGVPRLVAATKDRLVILLQAPEQPEVPGQCELSADVRR